mgnify:CR=1 FL=1
MLCKATEADLEQMVAAEPARMLWTGFVELWGWIIS